MLSLLVLLLLNIALIPAEAALNPGVNLPLIIRGGAWAGLTLIAICYSGPKVHRIGFAFFILVVVFFVLSNLELGLLVKPWSFYIFLSVFGALYINNAIAASEAFSSAFLAAVDLTIKIWVGAFVVQGLIFFLSGHIVDFHSYLVPYSEQRAEAISYGFARIGGIHIEPGTYANWLYGLILFKVMVGKGEASRTILFATFTLPLTGSFWGAIAFTFLTLGFLVNRNWFVFFSRQIYWMAPVAVGVLLVGLSFLSNIMEYFLERSTLQDNSSFAKVLAYEEYSRVFVDYLLVGAPYYKEFCEWCYSPQDAGVWLNLTTKIGVIPAMALLLAVLISCAHARGIAVVVMFIPALFAKWYYWDQIFWLVLSAGFVHLFLEGAKAGREVR